MTLDKCQVTNIKTLKCLLITFLWNWYITSVLLRTKLSYVLNSPIIAAVKTTMEFLEMEIAHLVFRTTLARLDSGSVPSSHRRSLSFYDSNSEDFNDRLLTTVCPKPLCTIYYCDKMNCPRQNKFISIFLSIQMQFFV